MIADILRLLSTDALRFMLEPGGAINSEILAELKARGHD